MSLPSWTLGAILALSTIGCAGAQLQEPSPRLALRQEAATLRIEGNGTVEGAGLRCGPRDADGCAASSEELWSTVVVAKPEPGWKFVGWKRVAQPALAPGYDDVTVYTATFERDAAYALAR
jgi:hypothetical protein